MLTTTLKGHIAQLEVEKRATEKGCIVSRPVVEARYDLVVDDGTSLYRVQVKYTAQSNRGAIDIGLRKFGGNKEVGMRMSDVKTYSSDEVDVLAVFSPVTGKVYWLPIEVFEGKTVVRLRLEPSKNNQKKRVLVASGYEW